MPILLDKERESEKIPFSNSFNIELNVSLKCINLFFLVYYTIFLVTPLPSYSQKQTRNSTQRKN